LIPYVNFQLGEPDDSLKLRQLTIGPSHSRALTRFAAQGLLQKYSVNADCAVSLSGIPYREL
jgi:hypothetical protein